MDEPMTKFQRVDTTEYQLLTVDMPTTEKLLTQAGIHFKHQGQYILLAATSIDSVQQLLAEHRIFATGFITATTELRAGHRQYFT